MLWYSLCFHSVCNSFYSLINVGKANPSLSRLLSLCDHSIRYRQLLSPNVYFNPLKKSDSGPNSSYPYTPIWKYQTILINNPMRITWNRRNAFSEKKLWSLKEKNNKQGMPSIGPSLYFLAASNTLSWHLHNFKSSQPNKRQVSHSLKKNTFFSSRGQLTEVLVSALFSKSGFSRWCVVLSVKSSCELKG